MTHVLAKKVGVERKVLAYGLTLLAVQILGLIRSVVVARAVGPDVQGEAAVIGLLAGFFSCLFVLNTAWQLVQSPLGGDPAFRSSLQGITLLRGGVSSLLIAAATWMLLGRLGYPHLRVPAATVSLVLLVDSLTRLDPWLHLRSGRYRPLLWVESAGPLGALVVSLSVLAFTQGVWVPVVGGLGASAARALTSHLIASGPWLLRVHREHVAVVFGFGWPLIPAGLTFWLNSQTISMVLLLSDRVTWLPDEGIASLGAMSVVGGMAMLPFGLFFKLIQVLVVPQVSRADVGSRGELLRAYMIKVLSLASVVGFLGGVLGPILASLALGPEYSMAFVAIPWLAGVLGLKVVRAFVDQVGVALGETRTQLLGNSVRLSALPMTLIALKLGGGLSGVALAGFLGEWLAVMCTLRSGGPMDGHRRAFVGGVLGVVSMVLLGWLVARWIAAIA